MKVYLYKDGLCDPLRNIGACRQLSNASEVDKYVKLFVGMMNTKHISRFRIFITDDDVEFSEVDHYVFMDEPIGREGRMKKIEEVDIVALKRDVDKVLNAQLGARERIIKARAEKKKAPI